MKTKRLFLQWMLVMFTCLAGMLSVSAQTYYGIYVKGIQVTSANASDVLGDGTVKYDAVANKLTLNNAIINTGDLSAQGMTLNQNGVTLELIGTNEVTGMKYSGLKINDDATITGDGKLIVSGADCGILFERGYNVYSALLTIAGGAQVVATGAKGISGGDTGFYTMSLWVQGVGTSLRATGTTYSIGNLGGLYLFNGLAIVSPAGAMFTNYSVCDADGNVIAGQEVVIMKPVVVRGDVDGDGNVTINDVTSLIDYLLSGDASAIILANADCDQDGSVTISDVTSLIDYLLSGTWPPETFTVNGVTFKMIKVDGGTFWMGATDEQAGDYESNETPVNRVHLSSYYIGETEVTQELWREVMGTNPSYFLGDLQRPVEKVSWNDCQTFLSRLNELTGKNFRLPTEAEWEFAARGGNKSKGYKYAGSNTIGDVAWYTSNSSSTTHAVGTKAPNELGLYDMSGNVFEWCQDWYGSYTSGEKTDPTGPATGSYRVLRGGSWGSSATYCRVSYRNFGAPTLTFNGLGLRLAL